MAQLLAGSSLEGENIDPMVETVLARVGIIRYWQAAAIDLGMAPALVDRRVGGIGLAGEGRQRS